MKVNRGDVEQPGLVVEWHATRTGVPTEVSSANPVEAPLNPVHDDKSTISADIAFCRVCWDEANPKNSDPLQHDLVQPCQCRGSQANIHLSCLRAWQRAVLEKSVAMGDERAFRCGVCKAMYAIPPESQVQAQTRHKLACLHVLRLALVIACSFSLYCGIDNVYIWPMLVFIGLVLPMSDRGVRAAMFLSILFIIVVLRFLAPYSTIKSRVAVVTGASEGYLGQGTHGSRASLYSTDLKPGTLLLASGGGGAFPDSTVVLLFSHSATDGSQGVILNKRVLSRAGSVESGCFWSSSDLITECTRAAHADRRDPGTIPGIGEAVEPIHYFGGSTFALDRLVMMHMFANIPGSKEIVLARNDEELSAWAAMAEGSEELEGFEGFEDEHRNIKVFVGGLMADVLAQRWEVSFEHKPVPIWIFHGVTTWTTGKLVDEIENGAWTVRSGTLDALMYFSKIFADVHDYDY